jgi:glucan-binding YG repeat protein
MNKKIKRIIAMSLALTAFSVASPVKYFKFINFNKLAYASSDDGVSIEESYLDDLNISNGSLSFSEKKTEYTVKIDENTESIVVKAKAKDNSDEIKINNEEVTLDSSNIAEKEIKLDKGRNLIRIKLVTDDYGLRIYNLVVNRGSADQSSSDNSDGDLNLNNLALSNGELSFSPDETSYNVNVNSSIKETTITAQPYDDNDDVKVNGIKLYKDDDYKTTVELNNGQNEVSIDLEDSEGNEKTYTLNINRGGTTEGDTSELIDNTQDPIYLGDIVIEDGEVPLNFMPKVTSYAVDVKDDLDKILIKAKPQYDDLVKVNGSNSTSPYVRSVNLKEGKNVITIKVNNSETYDKGDKDYEERTYTLTVYRGTSEGTSQPAAQNSGQNTSTDIKANQWININGKWQYNDATGSHLKSTWYFDKNYGKSYYFKEDGTMATGWITYNGNWYYLDDSGAMKTGWIKDSNGSWYYLDSSGIMAKNTTVDGYKIGSNGAWIN